MCKEVSNESLYENITRLANVLMEKDMKNVSEDGLRSARLKPCQTKYVLAAACLIKEEYEKVVTE